MRRLELALSPSPFVLAACKLEVVKLKNCKLCRYRRLCNPLPGICILVFYATVGAVAIGMAYVFITQELM